MNSQGFGTYEELVALVNERGFFKRRYAYYALCFGFVSIGTAFSFYILTITDSIFLQMLNAVFLAFLSVQAGMLGHDCSHKQVFVSDKLNRICGMLLWGLFGGLSEGKWYEKHNAHHKYVNRVGLDPDLAMPFLFSKKQIGRKSSVVNRIIRPYQHVIFFLALPLVYFSMTAWTWRHLLKDISWHNFLEIILIAAHFILYGFFVFYFLPFYTGVLFIAVWILVAGLYMSVVFAPNHKGEEVLSAEDSFTWKNQITSTRNIRPSLLVFQLMGGLNFQIEHHLFTTMPRTAYLDAHPLIKEFCAQHGISYHETTLFGSFKEMYRALKRTVGK